MNKKILLSTILASSILGASSNSFAVINFSYNSNAANGNFIADGNSYNTFSELVQAVKPRLKNDEDFNISKKDEVALFTDLINNKNNLIDDFVSVAYDFTGQDKTLLKTTLTSYAEAMRKGVKNNTLNIDKQYLSAILNANTEDLDDYTDFLEADTDAVINTGGSFDNYENLPSYKISNSPYKNDIRATSKIQKEFRSEISAAVKNADGELKELINLTKSLRARGMSGEDTGAELEEAIQKLYSSKEFTEYRNSPSTQEKVKNIFALIEKAAGSEDDNAQEAIDIYLSKLEEDGPIIFADTSRVSDADLPSFQKSDAHTVRSLVNSSITTSNIINDRVAGFAPLGVAAGEPFQTYGAWVKGNYSQGKQKGFKSEPGYKFDQKGVTIGVDTGDETMIGIAGSYAKNDVKNTSGSSAKDKIDTYIGTIYGMHAFNQELFLSAQGFYGKSGIKKSRSTGDLDNNSATAKTKGTLMGGRAEVGYVYPINEDTQLIPSVGFAFNKVSVKGYQEKGNGLNRKVDKMLSARASGLAGLAIRHVAVMGTTKIMPELHANVDYAFKSKTSKTGFSLGSGVFEFATPVEKAAKAFYNIGTSVKFGASEMLDITAGYDLGLSKKFISHTGSLKLKVNF